MPVTESSLPKDWCAQGDMDLQAARILLAQDGPFPIVAFHMQQAIEKYLKGYLLSTGWTLRRIHDLETLVREAISRDADFVPYLAPCQEITEFYIETRYPVGVSTSLDHAMLAEALSVTERLVRLVRDKLGTQG
jgi:HEPN domain-containing protein